MSDETIAYARTFGQIIDDLIATLTGLDDAALNAPIDLDEANTMAALATHTIGAGAFWTLVLVGGQRIPRDRPAEFRAVASGPELIARLQAWRAALDALLPDLPEAALGLTPSPPAEYGFTPVRNGELLTGRACILHAIEHSAMHLGHLQLTRQLVLARRDGGLPAAGAA
ncbi:DinB family protein [Oscillochloris sp. ZM17-4]|uniref:DinB family protein n=1 Tax=Oscillochloris sp. ZM17-4 TaxID=2866714 RepID=UPI001C72EF7A|nr:DinB family protein [Oscillochloris sp. ZM17-4]MBX0331071.1 DinB family protein [Oscillochloris sp. ZM17-4]